MSGMGPAVAQVNWVVLVVVVVRVWRRPVPSVV
jgi:hypothetical protein